MNDQPDMFGYPRKDARKARDEAFKRIENRSGPWMDRALGLMAAAVYGEMTGEELRLSLMRLGLEPPHHHNAWGALTSLAIKRGILVKTGRYAQMKTERSHARSTPILRRNASQ